MQKRLWPAIEENESGELDQEPEATVEEIMQRGRTRAQLTAERALAYEQAEKMQAERESSAAAAAARRQPLPTSRAAAAPHALPRGHSLLPTAALDGKEKLKGECREGPSSPPP